jgi:hypothetical protein
MKTRTRTTRAATKKNQLKTKHEYNQIREKKSNNAKIHKMQ